MIIVSGLRWNIVRVARTAINESALLRPWFGNCVSAERYVARWLTQPSIPSRLVYRVSVCLDGVKVVHVPLCRVMMMMMMKDELT